MKNDRIVEFPVTMPFLCVHQLFEQQAINIPSNIAVVSDHKSITYQELNLQANKIANYLRDFGIKYKQYVAVYQDNSIEAIICILGILKAGAAFVPIDTSYPKERVSYMIQDAQVSVILAKDDIKWLPNSIICIHSKLLESLDKLNDKNPINITNKNDPIYLIYTSGTTGKPKGAIGLYSGISNLLKWYINYCNITSDDKILIMSSLAFDLTYKNIFSGLICGAEVHLTQLNPFDPEKICTEIYRRKISLINCTPSVFYSLIEQTGIQKIKSLKNVCLGGEPIAPNRLKDFAIDCPYTKIINTYGPAECSDIACAYTLTATDIANSNPIPIGRPISNVEVFLLNDSKKLIAANEIGEIYIGGACVGGGYYNRDTETQEKFVKSPFISSEVTKKLYRTGDYGKWNSSDEIIFMGRVDEQIKLRGIRIETKEIENVIVKLARVKQAIVVGNRYTEISDSLDAYLVTNNEEIDISNLKQNLEQKLPEFMIPNRYFTINEMPLSPNGKLDKNLLIKKSKEVLSSKKVSPRNYVEQALLEIWGNVLGRPYNEISIYDSFFDLGGYSLLVTQVKLRIQRILGVKLPIETLFICPTISKLANKVDYIQSKLQEKETFPYTVNIKLENMDNLLSFSQQRIWFLSKLIPDNAYYSLPSAFLIKGPFCIIAFKKSLDRIINRHEILRTYFDENEGVPKQHTLIKYNIKDYFNVVDLRELTIEEANTVWQKKASLDANSAFDLSKIPLIKATTYLLPNDSYILYFNIHHIIFDGWSWSIFKRELSRFYNSIFNDEIYDIDSLKLQYSDYAKWQRIHYTDEYLEKAKKYWSERISSFIDISLPTDFSRDGNRSYKSQTIRKLLPLEIHEQLKEISQDCHVTFFTIFITNFIISLYKYTGTNKYAVAMPVANRLHEDLEDLIGCFSNTILFLTEIDSELTLKEFLQLNKDILIEILSHQNYPFEKLVENINIQRDPTKNPLSQIMFSFQNQQGENLNFINTSIEQTGIDLYYSRFDIEWQVWVNRDDFSVEVSFNNNIYKKNTIEHLIFTFEEQLKNLSVNLNRKLREIYFENNQNLAVLYGKEINWGPLLIHQYIEKNAAKIGNKNALEYNGDRVTFLELNAYANKLASFLRDKGVRKGDRLVILLGRDPISVMIFIACLKIGAIFVPLPIQNPQKRNEKIIEEVNPRFIIKENDYEKLQYADKNLIIYINDIKLKINSDITRSSSLDLNVIIDENEPVYIIYTSGTSGSPKGVIITHKSLKNVIFSIIDEITINSKDIWLALTNFSFDIAFLELFAPLVVGAELVLSSLGSITDNFSLHKKISKNKITVIQTTPFIWKELLEKGWGKAAGAGIKIISGGDILSRSIADALLKTGAQLWNAYGPTETAIWSILEKVSSAENPILIGAPLANTRCYVVNDQKIIMPINKEGELYISGDGVGVGYLNLPETTKEKFVEILLPSGKKERCYRTGDYVTLLDEKKFLFHGRKDEQIKIGGVRVEISEIENVLNEYPNIEQCAVIVKEAKKGKIISAYIKYNNTHIENKEDETLRLHWEEIFENLYAQSNENYFCGWVNSYTRQQFLEYEMEDWLSCAASIINKIKSESVLEIGCGLGLLISKLAPGLKKYIATDMSFKAINSVKARIELKNVVLFHESAENAHNHIDSTVNTIIINSVVQYFPSIEYLESLLSKIISKLKNNSVIFIGDVRGYDLGKLFHASLIKCKNKIPENNKEELLFRIDFDFFNDAEILLNPDYFLKLKKRFSDISCIEIYPKLGRYSNELTKYRFDVLIYINSTCKILTEELSVNLDLENWREISFELIFEKFSNKIFSIVNIPNAFLAKDLEEFGWVFNSPPQIFEHPKGIEPYKLSKLAKKYKLSSKFRISSCKVGYYDAIFYPSEQIHDDVLYPYEFGDRLFYKDSFNQRNLREKIFSYLAKKLPHYMIPSELNMISRFPLTINGKIDKKNLQQVSIFHANYVPNTDIFLLDKALTLTLSDYWSELLNVASVKLEDNFFDLGGHSLLAMKLIAATNKALNLEVTLYDFYKNPTLAGHLAVVNNLNCTVSKKVAASNSGNKNLTNVSVMLPKIFIIPPVDGKLGWYESLVESLSNDFECIGFEQPRKILKNNMSIHDIARFFYEKIKLIQPYGVYQILGWSFGGLISIEVSNLLLNDSGALVNPPILIDTPTPNHQLSLKTAYRNLQIFLPNTEQLSEGNHNKEFIFYNSEAYINYELAANKIKEVIAINSDSDQGNWGDFFDVREFVVKNADHYSILNFPYVMELRKIIGSL